MKNTKKKTKKKKKKQKEKKKKKKEKQTTKKKKNKQKTREKKNKKKRSGIKDCYINHNFRFRVNAKKDKGPRDENKKNPRLDFGNIPGVGV